MPSIKAIIVPIFVEGNMFLWQNHFSYAFPRDLALYFFDFVFHHSDILRTFPGNKKADRKFFSCLHAIFFLI